MEIAFSTAAIFVSVLSFFYARGANKREGERRLEELRPVITGRADGRRIVLRLEGGSEGVDAGAWLPHAQFADVGDSSGDHARLGHPWPRGWEWMLPELDENCAGEIAITITIEEYSLSSRRVMAWSRRRGLGWLGRFVRRMPIPDVVVIVNMSAPPSIAFS